jgi:indolepyruvate ferredoxin oxidoreductase, beta subunit
MSSWSSGGRPLTIAILALGGEGGGVMSDWIVAAAQGAGYAAQNTSVAGVAQRTGATVYYIEVFPRSVARPDASVRDEPIMSIFPAPGEVDVVIASELMECGRAIQRGFATPDRTTLITSTNRVYSIDEKLAMSDGRVDDRELIVAARRSSKRLVAADFAKLAQDNDSVISASLFGGLAGSGVLPLTREQLEAPIRAFGKDIEPSLAAFAAGFDVAAAQVSADAEPVSPTSGEAALPVTSWAGSSRAPEEAKASDEDRRNRIAATDPAALVGPALAPLAHRTLALPAAARSMILHGLVRAAVYQDQEYAERYLARVARFAAADAERDGAARLTREAARHIALWMCYQDTIHVALQKTRRARMQRIRAEAKAKPGQLLEVHEYLHPQIDEITDTLPAWIGATLRSSRPFQWLVRKLTHKGMILNTTSVTGYALLTAMARARPLRTSSLRFQREQRAIEAWIEQALAAARTNGELAREIVECQGVLKGYGPTYSHGSESFAKLMAAATLLSARDNAAGELAELRAAALADEHGAQLAAKLAERAAA